MMAALSNDARRSAVLVTGASTGIGFATAVRLARHATIVYAGVRRVIDGEALVRAAGENVRPLTLDVADPGTIDRAAATVASAHDVRLDGVVNNAGISVAGPLEILPAAELRRQFDVNFFGAIAVVQVFLPLLRASRGRIVNVSSIAGKVSLPYVGAYAASKHALEAASDALRQELRPFGITVSLVEPGAVRTPIWSRSSTASMATFMNLPHALRAPYEVLMARMNAIAQRMERGGLDPSVVARTIERALTAPRPRARYLVGSDARVQLFIGRLPEALRDRIVGAAMQMTRS